MPKLTVANLSAVTNLTPTQMAAQSTAAAYQARLTFQDSGQESPKDDAFCTFINPQRG